MNYNSLPFDSVVIEILNNSNINFNILHNKIVFNTNYEYLSTYKQNIDLKGCFELFDSLTSTLYFLDSKQLCISYVSIDDIIILNNQFLFINSKKIFQKINNSILINTPYNKDDITLPIDLKKNNRLPVILDFEKGIFFSIGKLLDIIFNENKLNIDTPLKCIIDDCLNGNFQNILV